MGCNEDCFNCPYDDCILTDKELIKQMRKPKKKQESKIKRKCALHRIKTVKGDFKKEFILTPLPGSPESQRTWEGEEDES